MTEQRGYQALREAIVSADYRSATATFVELLRDEEPLKKLVTASVDTTAPYIQAPAHIMSRPDGGVQTVNYDHTVLGWRASMQLAHRLGERGGLLPITQAIWYVPQGLSPWDQVLCRFPGHYARDKFKCDSREEERAQGHNFDGPAWETPQVRFEDCDPIRGGSGSARLHDMAAAIRQGDRADGYGLFLGLADDPEQRTALKEAMLFAGIIDLQESIIDRREYQNIGHKARRARAMVDLADDLGWENAHGLFYTVVPDMGTTPRLHALWTQASSVVETQFRQNWQTLKQDNRAPLTPREVEETVDVVLWGLPSDVVAHISQRLREGKALLAIGDAIVVAFCRFIIDQLENRAAYFIPGHALDYCNVVHHWIRTYDNPHQAKALYMEAVFVNDMVRADRLFPRDPENELRPDEHAAWAEALPLRDLLPTIDAAITDLDADRAIALVDAYLARTEERQRLLATIAFSVCKFQNDPHIQRNCISTMEEFTENRSGQRDTIIRAATKYASHATKRSLDFGAYDIFRTSFAAG